MDRLRKSIVDSRTVLQSYQIGYGGTPVHATVPIVVAAESVTDVIGNYPNFNPVSHIKVNQVPGVPEPFLKYPAWPPGASPDVLLCFGERAPFNFGPDLQLISTSEYDLRQPVGLLPGNEAAVFTRDALDKAIKQVPEEVSIANFLFELREVKSLIPRINGWQTISDGILNLNFGWIPLISDIRKFLTLVARVRKRIEHLIKVNKRTVTISHQRTYVIINDDSPPGAPEVDPSDGLTTVAKTSYEEVKARQHLSVSYDLDLHGADVFIQAMCSALGLMNPASIIWNAIPFSFVVDWFINLGNLLDSAAGVEPFKGKIKIRAASHSFKTKTFVGYWSPQLYPFVGARTMNKYATALIRGYHRRSGTPEGTIELTGLTPYQLTLAAALIASNANWGPPAKRRRKSP